MLTVFVNLIEYADYHYLSRVVASKLVHFLTLTYALTQDFVDLDPDQALKQRRLLLCVSPNNFAR